MEAMIMEAIMEKLPWFFGQAVAILGIVKLLFHIKESGIQRGKHRVDLSMHLANSLKEGGTDKSR
ncbi:hypothetical protein BVY04_04455 [bacterium M21]|nr:hypothetical protein BVY04_04455 [bacterium M21]